MRVACLVAFPLLVSALLAAVVPRGGEGHVPSRQDDAVREAVRRIEAAAHATLLQAAELAARQVLAASERPEALHRLELGGKVSLVALYRDGQRLFPPEEPAPLLPEERERLAAAGGALAVARTDLARADVGVAELDGVPYSWGWLADGEGTAVLHCRRQSPQDPASGELCLVLSAAFLRGALGEALDAAAAGSADVALALLDPFGRPLWSEGGSDPGFLRSIVQPLDGPLRGWQLAAGPRGGPRSILSLPGWAVPALLLAGWLPLVWHLLRAQRARLAETRRRADIAAELLHELRTPVANLRLYADLIHRRAKEAEAVRDFCAIIDAEADRLGRLTDNAVAFARGEPPENSGWGVAVPDRIIGDTVERLRPLCEGAGCSLGVSLAAAAACRFDGAAVEQILTNLIDNARKYAPGGAIEVAGWTERREGREWLVLGVRDHGAGIPARQRESIFGALVRGGIAAGGAGGFGLGLAAVRRLARGNGGDVRVEDAGPGARFIVWLAIDPGEGPVGRYKANSASFRSGIRDQARAALEPFGSGRLCR